MWLLPGTWWVPGHGWGKRTNFFTVNTGCWKYPGSISEGFRFTFLLMLLVLLRWQWHPVVPDAVIQEVTVRLQQQKVQGFNSSLQVMALSFPECCALGRMYFAGFTCPGGSSGLIHISWFYRGGISCSSTPGSHCRAPLLSSVKMLVLLCLPWWARRARDWRGSAHAGCLLFFRGSMSPKVCLKIIWSWNPCSRRLFLLTWARTGCTPARDPSRTLPVSWVRTAHTHLAQHTELPKTFPEPCSV